MATLYGKKNGKLSVRSTVMLNNLCPLEATNLETDLKKWLPENYYGLVTNFRGQFLIFFQGPSQILGFCWGIYHFRGISGFSGVAGHPVVVKGSNFVDFTHFSNPNFLVLCF